jgi:hypothetical protein
MVIAIYVMGIDKQGMDCYSEKIGKQKTQEKTTG